jgi:hypothetical protein
MTQTQDSAWWPGTIRGDYDSDHDRIVCEFCDWYDAGGPTACAWAYHDHLAAEHIHPDFDPEERREP